MLNSLVYFMPCLVSFLWLSIFLLKKKNLRQKFFTGILALNAAYYTSFAFYIMPDVNDYFSLVVMDSISMPIMPILFTVTIAYLYIIYTKKRPNYAINLLMVPAVISGTIIDLLYYILGYDKTAEMARMYDNNIPYPAEYSTEIFRIYGFMVDKASGIIGFAYMLIVIALSALIMKKEGYRFGNVFRFFFKGEPTTPSRAIAVMMILLMMLMMPLPILGRKSLMMNPEMGLTLSICGAIVLFCINYLEYFSYDNRKFTLHQLSNIQLDSQLEKENTETTEEKQEPESEYAPKQKILAVQLRHLFEVDHIYNDDELTLASLSDKMGIGRTTLSTVIKSMYNMPFRDVVNNYRIEAAKSFMLNHPTTTQEIVAQKCGFKNSSYLNTKFKDITGETPSMWLAKQSHKQLSE